MVFTKFPSCIVGPVATVALPAGQRRLGDRGGRRRRPRRLPRSRATGPGTPSPALTVGQDLSERVAQLAGTPPQFSLAKSHPGFGPTGPVLVTPDEFADRDDIGFESRLGDEVIQHGRTSQLIFPIDVLVEHISATCPLLPGDLIFTGTPGGVGNRRTPPRFLRGGEVLSAGWTASGRSGRPSWPTEAAPRHSRTASSTLDAPPRGRQHFSDVSANRCVASCEQQSGSLAAGLWSTDRRGLEMSHLAHTSPAPR